MSETRSEKDSMGEFAVPADALYGVGSARAKENFPISELRFSRDFIRALGLIKAAAAQTNQELGLLDDKRATAVILAANEVAQGKLDEWFVLDIFQTGSGTSTNMNANEVIANRANQILSEKLVHPNDHVNMCQSSNDVIPSAIQLSFATVMNARLLPALDQLEASLSAKSKEFWPVVKTGRTHLQDATPIRLGQEFAGYAGQIEAAKTRIQLSVEKLSALPLGGTAVGTGVNAHPQFAAKTIQKLADATKLPLVETKNHFAAQATLDTVVSAHGTLKTLGVALTKIGNDIRFMGCGPRAGIAELEIPAVQPGSSIMPGKVNPVIIESVSMVCARVFGNDTTITFAGATGSIMELNVMMPIAAHCALESANLLANASTNFASRCIDGLKATGRGPQLVEQGLMLGTALAPHIGYDNAAAIAKEANQSGRTVREVAQEKTALTPAQLDEILRVEKMTDNSTFTPGSSAG